VLIVRFASYQYIFSSYYSGVRGLEQPLERRIWDRFKCSWVWFSFVSSWISSFWHLGHCEYIDVHNLLIKIGSQGYPTSSRREWYYRIYQS